MSGLVMTGRTDTGMVREHNEDCFLIVPESGIALLADGMGGHLAGEVAAAMAVDQVTHHLLQAFAGRRTAAVAAGNGFESRVLVEAIKNANAAIHQASVTKPEQSGMGTTIVAVTFHDNLLTVAHVGDSRLYRYRDGALNQLTEDHSMVQELLRRGLISAEEARTSVNRNLVTRALGVDPVVEVDVHEEVCEDGDVYLLCSDGLTDMVEPEIVRTVVEEKRADLAEAAADLVELANRNGGRDNISVIIVRVPAEFLPQSGWAQRFLAKRKQSA